MLRHFVHSIFGLLLLAGSASAQQPAYKIESTDSQVVNATITYEIQTKNFAVSRWMIFLPEPPELPSQPKLKVIGNPAGKVVNEKSPLGRKVRFIDISVAKPAPGAKMPMKLEIESTLRARKLVELKPGEKPPVVPALTVREMRYYLSPTPRADFNAKAFQDWLDAKKLRRNKGENPLELAARVLNVLRADYKYHYDPNEDKRASVACKTNRTDCGGMTFVFVAAMRANDIPARALVGRFAKPRKPRSTASDPGFDQPHIRAELFLAEIGWVPVEPAFANAQRRRPVRDFIGNDSGDLLVLHIDTDLVLPFPDKNREVDLLQIGPYYWVTGNGKFDGAVGPNGWEVKTTPLGKK
ncbi:MAG: transglutaminase family protein [Planctomycetia bacterium]|nr:transglutaminase family protein [Planctomycetia bacterium]